MGLLSWTTRKGPLGTIARQIGDSYREIQAANPSYTPEQVQVAVGGGHPIVGGGGRKLDMVVYSLVEKQTGRCPLMHYDRRDSFETPYADMAAKIVTDELLKRGVPEEFIQFPKR